MARAIRFYTGGLADPFGHGLDLLPFKGRGYEAYQAPDLLPNR